MTGGTRRGAYDRARLRSRISDDCLRFDAHAGRSLRNGRATEIQDCIHHDLDLDDVYGAISIQIVAGRSIADL
jgi:hypothetical protein